MILIVDFSMGYFATLTKVPLKIFRYFVYLLEYSFFSIFISAILLLVDSIF
jgi:hypothetical protein